MESKIVTEFMQQTGCEIEVAYTFLQSKRWDLKAALEGWQFLQEQSYDIPNKLHSPSSENVQTSRGVLRKSSSIDLQDNKKLIRGISRATDNVPLVSRARTAIAQDFDDNPCFKIDRYFIETPEYTFTLPDLTVYGTDFKNFLEKDLIEKSALLSLEQSGRLNWWAEYGLCQKLWPLSTSGDGNCLLHAASLGMWGFHDRLLTLRKALYAFLKESNCQNALYRRWRWQQTRTNAQSGFVYSEEEWQTEWETIINMASTEPRREKHGRRISNAFNENDTTKETSATYESLEEIHVLALAHVLKRPIIIIADLMLKDMNGEPIAPIPFGGIYLPFEIPFSECHHSPLLLTYDMAHFSALVVMDKEIYGEKQTPTPALIPLVDSNNCLLPIHFNVDPGENFNWGKDEHDQSIVNSLILTEKLHLALLKRYLDVTEIATAGTPSEDEGAFSEDEIEKKFTEIRDISDDNIDSNIFGNNKNRAAKQLQSVAKQFGSIGKSMSRKLKKNFGKITKSTNSKRSNDSVDGIFNYRGAKVLCAQLHMKRHEYQNEMVQNYLQFAQTRFLKEMQTKCKSVDNLKLEEQAILEGPMKCINLNCNSLGTAVTSYMCQKCFDQQCKEELQAVTTKQLNDTHQARYGTGKSKFYRECDIESHNSVKRLPSTKRTNSNHTLYLSKSTFYNDTGTPFVTNSESSPTPLLTNNSTTNSTTPIITTSTSNNSSTSSGQQTTNNSQSLDSSCRNDLVGAASSSSTTNSGLLRSDLTTSTTNTAPPFYGLANSYDKEDLNLVQTKLGKDVGKQQQVSSVCII